MPLASGARLGPYHILGPLGAGGMGEVYRARDPRLNRDVAIKVLPEHLAQDEEARAQFEREAHAIAALSHFNILAIFDVGLAGNVSYAVTELLEGETLADRLARSPLPWRKALEIAAAVADGLAAAHAKGIIHQDLKPANIFLTADGQVKILDFGLAVRKKRPASRAEEISQTETLDAAEAREAKSGLPAGTIGYMAPEQVLGAEAVPASDIFSLGCVLYEMLTGEQPFLRKTAAQTMAATLEAQAPQEAISSRGVPREVERLIYRCLQKNPAERFQSALDLSFALRALIPVTTGRPRRPALRWTAAAALLLGSIAGGLVYFRSRASAPIDSLAVLPFTNASGDPNAEYLSDGITESLINGLSQLPLRVAPRNTVFRYKGRQVDPQDAARELNVRAVLTGRVVQRGDMLSIQTDLVDVRAKAELWGQRYNRKMTDLLAIEEEISKEILDKLRVRLSGDEQRRLARRQTRDTEAYQLYLKGRFHWHKRTEEGFRKGLEYFQQAIGRDPAYAAAYAGVADSYTLMGLFAYLPLDEVRDQARAAAARALEIDPALSEAHTPLGLLKVYADWDWAGAEREFRRAIELNPGNANAHYEYALLLARLRRFEAALAEMRRAQELEPLTALVSLGVGQVLLYSGRPAEAREQIRKSLELDPDNPNAYYLLGQACELEGRYPEAEKALRRAVELGRRTGLGALGHALAVSGKQGEARRILEQLLAQRDQKVADQVASIYIGLGDQARALDWLERSAQERAVLSLGALHVLHYWDPLRSEPRFQNLLRSVNLSP